MHHQLTLVPAQKRCATCGADKPLEAFRQCQGRDTRRRECLDCERASARVRARAWRSANQERAKQWVRENLDRSREQLRARLADPEKRASGNARSRERYREQPEEHARRRREWREANPEKVRESIRRAEAKRRAALAGSPYVEHIDRLVVLEKHDGICGICGRDVDPFDFHVDHIVPLSKGGEHSYANTQPAHPSCNWQKGAKAP